MNKKLLWFNLLSGGGGAPLIQATNITIVEATNASLEISWTRGDGDGVLILVKEGAPVDAEPSNGQTYTADANFGDGDEIGTGNFVVYNGAGTTMTITGLTGNNTYHIRAFEYFS